MNQKKRFSLLLWLGWNLVLQTLPHPLQKKLWIAFYTKENQLYPNNTAAAPMETKT